MAKVSIWAQWLGFATGVLLSSAFAVFLGWFIGWSHFRRLWRRRKVAAGKARRAGAAPRG
jgi:membrane protein DedA with SNARE-associated domain